MKRRIMLIFSCTLALCVVFSLCGCAGQSYTPPVKTAKVDTPIIGEKKTLRVGVDAQNPPFAVQVSGKIVGLDVDIAAALADELGLSLKVVDVGGDPEGALSKGDVDIVMSLDKANTTLTCWLSDPYIQTAVALFAPSSTSTVPVAGSLPAPLVAAQTSSMSAWEVNNQFGDAALVASNDLKTAFTSVETGSAAYVAADAAIGSYVAHTNNIDVHIVALMKQVSGYCVGVAKTNTDLSAAVSEALKTITTNGVVSVVESKWLGSVLDLTKVPLTSALPTAKKSAAPAAPAATPPSQEAPPAAEGTTGAGDAGSNAVQNQQAPAA
ncbi:MAG: transporter substrate-binding domain-containing protein [Raoultibacter sp.]